LTTGEGANGNCSDEGVNRDTSEEEQTEGAEMDVDRQSSPGAEECDDVEGETMEEQHGNGGLVAEERDRDRREPSEEQRKLSREPSKECEDGGEDSVDKDAEVLKALKPRIDGVKQKLTQATRGFGVFRLEMLHASISRLLQHVRGDSCTSRLESLEAFVADESNLTC
jgi:hypothetical protein